MGEKLIKPYEISVWEEKLTQIEGSEPAEYEFKETKIAIIGSDTMTGFNKVYNPVFNKKSNGEKTLSFSLHYKYFDPYIGNEDVINPFASLLINERKVKLRYDNKWYEFIIKDHTESSDGLEWTYTCTDAFVLELSKNGYNITFDSELNNNQGTATELATETLKDTDWQVGESDVLKQFIAEPIYQAQLVGNANIINASGTQETVPTPTTNIYVFYSYVKNQSGKYVQFIIRDENRQYTIDDNNVITDTNFRITDELTYDAENNCFKKDEVPVITIEGIENRYQANRLAYNQLTTYDPVMGRTVDRFKIDGSDSEVYRYTDYTYTTSNVVFNYIVNGDNFNALEDGTLQGWNPYTDQSDGKTVNKLELITKPELATDKELADIDTLAQIEGFLKVNFNGAMVEEQGKLYNTVYNSGIENQASIIQSITAGDKFVFRWRANVGDIDTLNPTQSLGLIVAKYDQDTPTRYGYYYKHIKADDIIMRLEPSSNNQPTELNNIITGGELVEEIVEVDGQEVSTGNYNYVLNDVVQVPSTKYIYVHNGIEYVWVGKTTPDEPVDGALGSFIPKDNNYLPYYYITGVADKSVSNAILSDPTENIGIFIYTTEYQENNPIYIQDIQLLRFVPDAADSEGKTPVLPANVPEATSVATEYYYLKPKEGTAAEDVQTYISVEEIQKQLGLGTITPLYNENSEKTLTISASQSNCFNILQTIAETFECWIDLVVGHDDNGYITDKYVYLREYAGKDNWVGFKYGINLDTIERNINSDEIVTKLIVNSSQSDLVDEGYVSIMNAPSNQSGESYILNFDYYYNQGLLNKEEVEADRLEFITAVAKKNQLLQEKEKERRDLEAALTSVGSTRNVYNSLVETAQNERTEALAAFEDWAGLSYEDYVIQHKTLIDEESDSEDDTSEQLTDDDTILETLGTIYITSATINNYSGLLTNIEKEYWEARKKLRGAEDYSVKYWTITDSNTERHIAVELSDYLPGFEIQIGNQSPLVSTVNKKYFEVTSNNDFEITFTAPSGYHLENNQTTYEVAEEQLSTTVKIINESTDEGVETVIKKIQDEKDELTKAFNNKYSRYIQEGTWNSTDYIDAELYYLDALQVSNTSAQPTVSYTINVVEVSELEGLEAYLFDAGDKTYIEDTEFFGWANVNGILTPAREEVIVSEVEWHLDEPDQNIITVQNYKTRFEDLFQRISATVQTVQYNEATYAKISSLMDANGTINQNVLQQSLNQLAGQRYNLTSNGSIVIDDDRVLIQNLTNPSNLVILNSEGIRISSDGGQNWTTAIDGRGINIGTVYTGLLNTDQVIIGNQKYPSFRWDKSGISAYKSTGNIIEIEGQTVDAYDLQTFVRYDQYGLYGIKDNGAFKAESLEDVKNKAHFAVTWDGFFIKNSYPGGGRVEITSDNDFRVMNIPDGQSEEQEKIKIGALEWGDGITSPDTPGATSEPTLYGIRINNNAGQTVMKTGDDGNLEITGTIYANAGEIGGMSVDNTRLRMDHIVLEPGTGIYSDWGDTSSYPFIISDEDGSATFNNVVVRGAIKTSVFEYEEIQAVGGAFMFRPSTTIKTATKDGNDLLITVEKPLILRDGAWDKLSNYNGGTAVDAEDLTTYGLTHIYQLSKEAIRDENEVITGYTLKLLGAGANDVLDVIGIDNIPGGSIIDMGYESGHSSYNEGKNNYGIGINSSDNYINLPPRAISLFETVVNHNNTPKVSYNYRGILGTLPQMRYNGDNPQVSILYHSNMEGTQGIYTDNMYIGDNSHYIAFYTDKNDNDTKKLRITGADIIFTYDDGEGGITEKTLDERIDEIETEGGEDAAVLVIDSSEGNVFRDNQGQTDLTVTIFYGASVIINKTQLTQSFGIGAYLEWEYKDNTNSWITLLSSDPRIDDNGFTIHLSAANVYNKANFRCKLVV